MQEIQFISLTDETQRSRCFVVNFSLVTHDGCSFLDFIFKFFFSVSSHPLWWTWPISFFCCSTEDVQPNLINFIKTNVENRLAKTEKWKKRREENDEKHREWILKLNVAACTWRPNQWEMSTSSVLLRMNTEREPAKSTKCREKDKKTVDRHEFMAANYNSAALCWMNALGGRGAVLHRPFHFHFGFWGIVECGVQFIVIRL